MFSGGQLGEICGEEILKCESYHLLAHHWFPLMLPSLRQTQKLHNGRILCFQLSAKFS